MPAGAEPGKLIVVAAPSGAGKTTLVRRLMENDHRFAFSVSACSRLPRAGETNGKDYYFLSPVEFRNRIHRGDFIEWEEVYPGSFYGTLREEVERLRMKGLHVVFDVDVRGALSLKRQYGDTAFCIFIRPPSIEVLEERLRSRSTDSEESIGTRLERTRYELGFEKDFDAVVINDDLDHAFTELSAKIGSFLATDKDTR